MARGRGGSHKGGRRQFTNPDEMNARTEREEREKAWRRNRGELESESGEEEESESSSEEEESEDRPAKGAEALIEIENPNRVVKKVDKKGQKPDGDEAGSSSTGGEVQLSRREREELEKQRARDNYLRLHAEGKTEQARADLARLALIRREREEAAKKREAEKAEREGASKTAAVNKTAAVKSVLTGVTAAPAGGSSAPGPGLKKKTAASRK